MKLYRQAIIIFGAVIPVLFAVGLVAIGFVLKSKADKTYEAKKASYAKSNTESAMAANILQQISPKRAHLERWNEKLSAETASVIGINLREISEKLPNKEIQQTAFDPSSNSSGMGKASAQNASSVRMGFRGTYRTLQKAFLELETRMPNLVLEEISMEPANTSAYLLKLQIIYTAWQN